MRDQTTRLARVEAARASQTAQDRTQVLDRQTTPIDALRGDLRAWAAFETMTIDLALRFLQGVREADTAAIDGARQDARQLRTAVGPGHA